jgi:hypothetical protein
MRRQLVVIMPIIVAAILTGCSSSENGVPEGSLARQALSSTYTRGTMERDNERDDLSYVAVGNAVEAYTFPHIHKEPVISISVGARGLCSDSHGYLWASVPDPPGIFKYRHGGIKQIRKLTKGLSEPWGCSVDPTSGDLAVVNGASGAKLSFLAVYRNGKGSPTIYHDTNIVNFAYCAYDSVGNLVIQGDTTGSETVTQYAELAKGSQTLQDVDLNVSGQPRGIQWDGSDFAVSYLDSNTIYRYTIANGQATLAGQTQLAIRGDVGIQQFGIQDGNLAAVTGSSPDSQIAAYPYPSGSPISHHHTIGTAFALTISVAPGAH